MAKAAKKKKGKYDITVKLNMSFDEAIKRAVNTPPPKKSKSGK